MSGTQLMPVWTRRSWRPRGLISHRWVLGETEGNPDVIKPKASRTSNRKVSASLCLMWCLRCCMCHHGCFTRRDAACVHPAPSCRDCVLVPWRAPSMPSPGPSPSVSPPVSNPPRCQYSRSLSEARFNALRQEYQEFRRAQESVCTHEPRFAAGHGSDSDSSSALL